MAQAHRAGAASIGSTPTGRTRAALYMTHESSLLTVSASQNVWRTASPCAATVRHLGRPRACCTAGSRYLMRGAWIHGQQVPSMDASNRQDGSATQQVNTRRYAEQEGRALFERPA